MGKRRSRLKIIADMLSVVRNNDNVGKTRIMYQANLSWKVLNQYLNNIIEAGLLSSDSSSCYVLTTKGRRFLKRVDEYSKSQKNAEKLLNDVKNKQIMLEKLCCSSKEEIEENLDS